ncbi:MAG: CoA pyrophosphatase [Candidatus Caldarchaeum sp.]|nr:CoA pyrophosphatase [Candidatus Caldarchaeum sp.]
MENRLKTLTTPTAEVEPGPGTAAVAVVAAEGFRVLVVKRVVRSDDPWSGQIAFPGGRWKPSDTSLFETALRELEEETGVHRDFVKAIGPMQSISPANMPTLKVQPFLFTLQKKADPRPGPEVQKVFWLPLKGLEKKTFTVYSSYLRREVTTSGYDYGGEVVWGMTARVIERFEEMVRDGV